MPLVASIVHVCGLEAASFSLRYTRLGYEDILVLGIGVVRVYTSFRVQGYTSFGDWCGTSVFNSGVRGYMVRVYFIADV